MHPTLEQFYLHIERVNNRWWHFPLIIRSDLISVLAHNCPFAEDLCPISDAKYGDSTTGDAMIRALPPAQLGRIPCTRAGAGFLSAALALSPYSRHRVHGQGAKSGHFLKIPFWFFITEAQKVLGGSSY
jgi:hypothetical protein